MSPGGRRQQGEKLDFLNIPWSVDFTLDPHILHNYKNN